MDASLGPRQLPFFVGRYRCEEYLGGGMADVYRARDTELPRDVAIKILKPANQNDEEYRTAFLDEAQLLTQCCYENVVNIFDKGEYGGCPYIVMEFLRGEDLGTLIKKNILGNLRWKLRIALQIARAMENVHAHHIIHRDLKPQNIHVDHSGRVKLVDFGIAKSIEWNKTATGLTKGTAYYMAPEQVLGNPVTFRTDIWAFGVVLFEMLTGGQRPFKGTNIESLWVNIVNSTPDFQLLAQPGTPEAIKRIAQGCLEKKPERRYSGFQQIVEEFEQVLQTMSDAPTTKTEPKRALPHWKEVWQQVRSQPKVGGIAAAAVGLLILATILVRALPSSPAKELKLETGDMVLVPGGPAVLGDEGQTRKVNLAPFYVDVTEVSNRAYRQFLRKTGRAAPEGFREDQPDYPVVKVTFFEAQDFAKWAGKRLLTDDEWEKAARGNDGRLFPWGNQADPKLANVDDNPTLGKHQLLPVNSFSTGASPFGARNLCGNAWEWVNVPHAPEPKYVRAMQREKLPVSLNDTFYSIRGGFFGRKLEPKLIADYSTFPGKLGSEVIGFRCARSVNAR